MLDAKSMAAVEKMLDFYALRHKVLAANVANADTPGYEAREATFDEELLSALREDSPEDIAKARFQVTTVGGPVNPEDQVARMTKNELLFETFSQIASARIRLMRAAITSK